MNNINDNQNSETVNNTGLTSFTPEEATPVNSNLNNKKQVNSEAKNVLNKDIVTRPLLWGVVVFLIFFGLVIGSVSVYRMYQTEGIVEETMISDFGPPPMPCGNGVGCALPPSEADVLSSTPVTGDTAKEADLLETEIKSIDSDLEEDIYSDDILGL
ncbi:MAG: hypothetical protein WD512_10745 [Candidatus Paceibacterota bacterium]